MCVLIISMLFVVVFFSAGILEVVAVFLPSRMERAELVLDSTKLQRNLQRLRQDTKFCDVKIHMRSRLFDAHRCVLSANSIFFSLLLNQSEEHKKNSSQNVYLTNIPEEDVENFEEILDFLYCGCVCVNKENFSSILRFAEYLMIEDLLTLLKNYLKEYLHVDTCLRVYLDIRTLFMNDGQQRRASPMVEELMNYAWEMVETKFYDKIICQEEILKVGVFTILLV